MHNCFLVPFTDASVIHVTLPEVLPVDLPLDFPPLPLEYGPVRLVLPPPLEELDSNL